MTLGTVTAAAESLRITQPAVSRLLATLESELGFNLFYRRGGRLVPSVEGEAFYREIEGTLAGLADIYNIAEDIKILRKGRLRLVGIGPVIFNRWLPSALETFSEEFPETHYSLDLQQRHVIEEWVASRQADLGFTLFPVDNPALDYEPIATVAAVGILPKGHPKASQECFSPADFPGESVILLHKGARFRELLDGALMHSGAEFTTKVEVSSAIAACHLVVQGLGVAISDPFTLTGLPKDSLETIRWEPELLLTYGATWPKDRKPSAQARRFIELMKQSADEIVDEIPAARPRGG